MKLHTKKVRGLGLCSGGLDSILSALVLRRQGIDVEWITFETPFFSSSKARKAAKRYKIHLIVKDITETYLKMLKNPPCGYGQNMNPCLDCHALMFKTAGRIMEDMEFDFLFSGEVAGQRPMSQTKSSLRYVEKNSGFEGYILRPLSAKRLPETIPEKKGLINRDLLLDFSGRSRKAQIALAVEFGVTGYPAPAGGCLLTDKNYSKRLKDLFEHQKNHTKAELLLLKYGRHLRINHHTKIIIGRTKIDNEHIRKYASLEKDCLIHTIEIPGPTVLIPNGGDTETIKFAASLCAGYTKAPENSLVDVMVISPNGRKTIQVPAIPASKARPFLL